MTFASDISRRRFLSITAVASLAIGTVGTSLPAFAQKATRTLRIGHQKGWLSILKARGTLEKRLARKIGLKLEKPRVLDQVVLDRLALSKFPTWKLSLFLRSLFARELWPTDAIHHKQWKKIAHNMAADGFEVHLAGGIRIQSNRYTVVLGPT